MPPVAHCAITIFGFTAISILTSPHFTELPRDLDVLEVFSMAESVVQAARKAGLSAEGFDYLNPGQASVLQEAGFLQAVTLLMRVKEGGLFCVAPKCKSFGWACSSVTKRKAGNIEGDPSSQLVRDGNFMARVAFLLFIVATARGLHACFENPSGSMIFSFLQKHIDDFKKEMACKLSFFFVDRCVFEWKRPTFKKRFKFMCNSAWFAPCARDCGCQCEHIPLMDRVDLPDGSVQVNGKGQLLKESGLYPSAMGEAMVQAWRTWAIGQQACSPSNGPARS